MFYLTPYLFALAMPMIIQILAAVIPAVFLVVWIWKKDTVEKESPGLIISLLICGVISTFCAVVTELIGGLILGPLQKTGLLYAVLMNFLVVGLSEEGFKYLFLKVRTWKNPEFNYRFDAIVYAVCVSLGFALFENIQYVMQYGLGTAAIRAVTAVPGHACFAVFMGIWYGQAKMCEARGDRSGARLNRILAVVIPVLAHGAYDLFASFGGAMTVVFVVFIILMFLLAFRAVKKSSLTDALIPGQSGPGGYPGGGPGMYGGSGGWGGPSR